MKTKGSPWCQRLSIHSSCTLLVLDYSLQPSFTFSSSSSSTSTLLFSVLSDCSFLALRQRRGSRAEQSQADGCEFKVSWSLAEVMEGYLWLYIWALAALPWWWRIKQHSCLFPEWCSAVLPDTTASLNLNVRSSSADAQDKANQHHMPRGWTLLPGPGVSHPHRPINQLQTAQFNPDQSSPCSDLLTLYHTHTHIYTL